MIVLDLRKKIVEKGRSSIFFMFLVFLLFFFLILFLCIFYILSYHLLCLVYYF